MPVKSSQKKKLINLALIKKKKGKKPQKNIKKKEKNLKKIIKKSLIQVALGIAV